MARTDTVLEPDLPERKEASPTLPASVHPLLVSTCDTHDLITLELDVAGFPDLATTVRRPSHQLRELVVWASRLPPSRWHGGLVLAASAAHHRPERHRAVEHTATLLGELVAADVRTRQAEALACRALELAGSDPLTSLGNRRTWRRALDEEARRAARYGTSTTVVVVDLDGLKRINDGHGHAAGDLYLRRGAAAVRCAARSVDVVCRLGGDEFGVLAPQTGPVGAGQLALRLRASLADAQVQASVGTATATDGDLDAAWQQADAEMYEAKRRRGPARQLDV